MRTIHLLVMPLLNVSAAEAQHVDRVLRTRLVTMLAYELGSGFLIN
jgi:hypothetical protein